MKGQNGYIKVAVEDVESQTPPQEFPKEKMKTFAALFLLFCSCLLTTSVISIVHEWVPDRTIPPLPDVFFMNIPRINWAFKIAETIGITFMLMIFVLLFLHRHRWIVLRRYAFTVSLLYTLRCVTMFVTILPVPSDELKCSPKMGLSFSVVMTRAFKLLSGFGMSVTGVHNLCGDYIYSGHTFMLVISYLYIKEYTPKSWRLLHWLTWMMCFTGVFCVLASHEHYSVDVVLAYYICMRLFWVYHFLCNHKDHKRRHSTNYISRDFWFPVFHFFEKNVGVPVPKHYSWPFEYPRSLAAWSVEYTD